MTNYQIYELYVELEEFKPKMWRRFQIIGDITLARLAYTIMILFEVRNKYSYEFRKDELDVYLKRHPEYIKHPERLETLNKEFKKVRYGMTNKKNVYMYKNVEGYEELRDATSIKVNNILEYEKDEIAFFYDPETNWKVKVVLEKKFNEKKIYIKDFPKVLEGEEYGIIEDVGSVKNLQKFREKLIKYNWNNKTSYKYYNTKGEGKKFFFDNFDTEDVNYRLKKLVKTYKSIYEKDYEMTYTELDVLNRKYKVYRKN